MEWIAQPLLTALELRRNMRHKMRLYAGEPQSTQGGTHVIRITNYPPPAGVVVVTGDPPTGRG